MVSQFRGSNELRSMSVYDEVEIEDFEFNSDDKTYYFPCPCGDKFRITREELLAGEELARCPSCSLIVRVIYDVEDLKDTETGAASASDAAEADVLAF